jgi:hypothetical protein
LTPRPTRKSKFEKSKLEIRKSKFEPSVAAGGTVSPVGWRADFFNELLTHDTSFDFRVSTFGLRPSGVPLQSRAAEFLVSIFEFRVPVFGSHDPH